MLEKFFDGQANITGNLTQKNGRDVPPRMAGNCGAPPVRVAELLMASLLASLGKPKTFEDGNDFRWLQYGTGSYVQATAMLWVPTNSVSSSGSPSSRSISTTSFRL
jgi:hypothetical protein